MSKKSVGVPKEMPKKPANFYFRFRTEAIKRLKGVKDANSIIKEEWEKIPEEEKIKNKAKDKEAAE